MFTLFQNAALCIPKVRNALRIPKLLNQTLQTAEPSKIMENFKKSFNNFREKKAEEIIIHTSKPVKLIK